MTVAVIQVLQSCLLRRYCPPAEYLRKLLQSEKHKREQKKCRRKRNGVNGANQIRNPKACMVTPAFKLVYWR